MMLCEHARRVAYAALTSVSLTALATTVLAHDGGLTGKIGEARFEVACTPEVLLPLNSWTGPLGLIGR